MQESQNLDIGYLALVFLHLTYSIAQRLNLGAYHYPDYGIIINRLLSGGGLASGRD